MSDPADDLIDVVARWAVQRQGGDEFDKLPAQHIKEYWRSHARALLYSMGGEDQVIAFCRAVLAIRPV